MSTGIAPEDYVAVTDFIGRYFWYVDENMSDEWVNCWTEDGVFHMIGSASVPKPLVGREALSAIPALSFRLSEGKMRHQFSNLFCDYGASRNEVTATFDELVTNWKSGGAFQTMAVCKMSLVREGGGWKVKRNDVKGIG